MENQSSQIGLERPLIFTVEKTPLMSLDSLGSFHTFSFQGTRYYSSLTNAPESLGTQHALQFRQSKEDSLYLIFSSLTSVTTQDKNPLKDTHKSFHILRVAIVLGIQISDHILVFQHLLN